MRKHLFFLTILMSLMASTVIYAQKNVDLSIEFLSPASGSTFPNMLPGDEMNIQFVVTNNGPDAVTASDSIFLGMNDYALIGYPGALSYFLFPPLSLASGESVAMSLPFIEGTTTLGILVDCPDDTFLAVAMELFVIGKEVSGTFFSDPGIDMTEGFIGGNNYTVLNDITFGGGLTDGKIIDLELLNVVPESYSSYPNLEAGDPINVTFTVKNNGPDDVELTDTIGVVFDNLEMFGHPYEATFYKFGGISIPSGGEADFTIALEEGGLIGSEDMTFTINTPEDQMVSEAFSLYILGFDEDYNTFIDEGVDPIWGDVYGNNRVYIDDVSFGEVPPIKHVDLDIVSVSPANGSTFTNLEDGDEFTIAVTIINNGPDAIQETDSILVYMENMAVLGLPDMELNHITGGLSVAAGESVVIERTFTEGELLSGDFMTGYINTPENTIVYDAMTIIVAGFDASYNFFIDPELDLDWGGVYEPNVYDMSHISFESSSGPGRKSADLSIVSVTPANGTNISNLSSGDELSITVTIKNNGPDHIAPGDSIMLQFDSLAILGHPATAVDYILTDISLAPGAETSISRTFTEGAPWPGGAPGTVVNTPENTTLTNAYRVNIYGKNTYGIFNDPGYNPTLGYPYSGNNTSRGTDITFSGSGTSIDNNETALNIRIYPNPAQDVIYIESDGIARIEEISITNLAGQTIQDRTLLHNPKSDKIDVTLLPSGLYHLHIFTDKGTLVRPFQVTR